MANPPTPGHDRAQLQKVMAQSPAIIATIDNQGRFVQVNAAAKNIWGYYPEELIGTPFLNLVAGSDVGRTKEVTESIMEGTAVTDFENRYIHRSGKLVPMEWSARWAPEDELIYAVGRDATDVKEAERKLAREHNMLQAIIDTLPSYIFVKNKDRELIKCNEGLYSGLLGFDSEEEALGKTVYDLYSSEIAEPMDEDDHLVIDHGQSIINREETAVDANENIIGLLTTKVPLHDEEGNITGLVGITQDITEQRITRTQIKETKERLDMVVRATEDAIYDWDIKADHRYWDESFKSSFSYNFEKEKYTIEDWAENVHPDDIEVTRQGLEQTLADSSQSEWKAEYRFAKGDGSYANVLERGFIVRDQHGEATRMIGALQDITAIKHKEKELRKSLKEKETLLAEIHHRVKNNLAVVSGMMQLQVYEESDSGFRSKLLDSVTRIQSMASIHEHLYRSGSFSELNFSENLKELIKRIVETVHVSSTIALEFDLKPVQLNVNQAIPCSLIINEVVTNILKYGFVEGEPGTILVSLFNGNGEIRLSIQDNGDGLPENFDSQQSDSLGLHLIRQLSKQLDAEYEYTQRDEGVEFSLKFEKSDVKGIGSANIS